MSTKPKELPFVVHEAEEGGYWAEAVGFNIFTQGETLDELRLMIADAIECHFGDSSEKPQAFSLLFDKLVPAARIR